MSIEIAYLLSSVEKAAAGVENVTCEWRAAIEVATR